MHLKQYIVVFFFLLLSCRAIGQTPIDGNINSGKGTIVINEIIKNRTSLNDSSTLILKVFTLGCTQWRGGDYQVENKGPYPVSSIAIDSKFYHLGGDNMLHCSIAKGKHTLEITHVEDKTFQSLRKIRFRVKKGRIYKVDCFVGSPFPNGYH